MSNEIVQPLIAAVTVTISVLTFIFTSSDKGRARDRSDRLQAETDRDSWKHRAEAAERRADDYADRYFKLRDERDNRGRRQDERDVRQDERDERDSP